MGQDGERRKKYSAAVIDGIKRKSRICVGDSIVRKTDSRLSKREDVVVCLPGARIEHVTERVEKDPRIQEFEADGSQRDVEGGFARKMKWDMWICGTALSGKKKCTQEMACILVERGPQCLPRDCHGW